MPKPIKQIVFKDFDIGMKTHPVTGNLIVKKNSEAVRQAVKNLVLTNKFERPFRPTLGCDVRSRLFDLFDPSTVENIQYDVRVAIENYEPRAELLDIGVNSDPDSNAIRVNVVFRPVNSTTPVSTVITLDSVR